VQTVQLNFFFCDATTKRHILARNVLTYFSILRHNPCGCLGCIRYKEHPPLKKGKKLSRFGPCLGLPSQPSWQHINTWTNKRCLRDRTQARGAAQLAVSLQWKVTAQSPLTVTRLL